MNAETGTECIRNIAEALPPLVSSCDTIESSAVGTGMPAAIDPLRSWVWWRDQLDSFYHEDWHSLRIHLEVDLADWPAISEPGLRLNHQWVREWYLAAMPVFYNAGQLLAGEWAGNGTREELEPHLERYVARFASMQFALWLWIGWLGRWRASVRARARS